MTPGSKRIKEKKEKLTFSWLSQDGRVDVEPLGMDDIYIADVEIGEPPQLLKIAIDTGSSDLYVPPLFPLPFLLLPPLLPLFQTASLPIMTTKQEPLMKTKD